MGSRAEYIRDREELMFFLASNGTAAIRIGTGYHVIKEGGRTVIGRHFDLNEALAGKNMINTQGFKRAKFRKEEFDSAGYSVLTWLRTDKGGWRHGNKIVGFDAHGRNANRPEETLLMFVNDDEAYDLAKKLGYRRDWRWQPVQTGQAPLIKGQVMPATPAASGLAAPRQATTAPNPPQTPTGRQGAAMVQLTSSFMRQALSAQHEVEAQLRRMVEQAKAQGLEMRVFQDEVIVEPAKPRCEVRYFYEDERHGKLEPNSVLISWDAYGGRVNDDR